MLAIFIALVTATNPNATTCATIDNGANAATWTTRSGRMIRAEYEDRGGDRLAFTRPVPKQVRQAEEALQYGTPGLKVITVCS